VGAGRDGGCDDDEALRELHARNQYYAVAGVFNLLERAAEGEGECPCATLVRKGGHVDTLGLLSQSEREEVARYARLSLEHLHTLEANARVATVKATTASVRSAALDAAPAMPAAKRDASRGSILSALVGWGSARAPAGRSTTVQGVLLLALAALAMRRGSQLWWR
jgi:hypothetical protein